MAITVNTATLVGSTGGASLLTPPVHSPVLVALVFTSIMLGLYVTTACTLVVVGRVARWSHRRRGRPRRAVT